MPAMTDEALLTFELAAVSGKKVPVAFGGEAGLQGERAAAGARQVPLLRRGSGRGRGP